MQTFQHGLKKNANVISDINLMALFFIYQFMLDTLEVPWEIQKSHHLYKHHVKTSNIVGISRNSIYRLLGCAYFLSCCGKSDKKMYCSIE